VGLKPELQRSARSLTCTCRVGEAGLVPQIGIPASRGVQSVQAMLEKNPTDNPEPHLLAALRLSLVDGVGPRIRQSLLARFGSSAGVFEAGHDELQEVEGVGPKIAAAIVAAKHSRAAETELARCRELGIDLVLRDDAAYPSALARICDPPGVLF